MIARRFLPLTLVSALALFGLAACWKSPSVPSPSAFTLTEAQNRDHLVLAPGDTLQLRLTSNPSTGCAWTIASDAGRTLTLIDSGLTEGASAPGAAGVAWWVFKAARTGSSTLTLQYRRSWEPAVVAEFSVDIDVR